VHCEEVRSLLAGMHGCMAGGNIGEVSVLAKDRQKWPGSTSRLREGVDVMANNRLEQSLINEYIGARGHDPDALSALPAAKRHTLLKDASIYASAKLCEVESRAHFVHEIRDALADIPKKTKA